MRASVSPGMVMEKPSFSAFTNLRCVYLSLIPANSPPFRYSKRRNKGWVLGAWVDVQPPSPPVCYLHERRKGGDPSRKATQREGLRRDCGLAL